VPQLVRITRRAEENGHQNKKNPVAALIKKMKIKGERIEERQ